MKTAVKTRTIALAGQPNTGKSTVFNRLTGAHQHVGNWPGKTIEQKSGRFNRNRREWEVVDLPGTYSLSANSVEERIARDFIIGEKPDVLVVMADASQLERSLYLLTEMKLLQAPVILALNMMDVAADQGKEINTALLEEQLGIPVVPMTASKNRGLDELLVAAEKTVEEGRNNHRGPDFTEFDVYNSLKSLLNGKLGDPNRENWMIVKLIEGDEEVYRTARERLDRDDRNRMEMILNDYDDGQLIMAGARYSWINEVLTSVLKRTGDPKKEKKDSSLDKYATHPFFGKILAFFILIIAFGAAMIVAGPVMGIVMGSAPLLAEQMRTIFGDSLPWYIALVTDGLIPGLSVAVCMLAYIIGIYTVFGILEDVGYLSRLAYLFDRSMNRVGLHGKSFMPLLMSFGCNIAGVTGTRVIDSWRQRMVTLVMVSIIPCLALWSVVSFMGAIFFGSGMPLVILSLLVVMVFHLAFTSVLMRKFIVPGEAVGLIMELPPYHKPNWKTVFSHVWVQAKAFVKRAVTLITLLSLIVWVLSYQKDGNMDNSILAAIGRFFDPVTSLLGLDWKLFVALMAAMIAKEASLSVIAVLYGLGAGANSITSFMIGEGGYEAATLTGTLLQSVSPASALAFIFAFFFSIPCLGTVATIYSETKSWKWTAGSSLYYIVTSLIAGGLAYRVGLLIF